MPFDAQPEAGPPGMNALAIAMVKNEADIVEAFVRHNLAFVDLMVVIDNDSTDGTRQILQALQREGLPLLVFDDPIFGYFQSEKVTHVYRKVAPIFQPELVYLLDADEFLHAPSRAALERGLARLAPGSVALLPWSTHVPTEQTTPERLLSDPLGAMPGRRRREEPTYYKAVIRRRPEDDAEIVIEQGNHMVHYAGGRQPATATLGGVAIVHLPVRSVEQLSAKVVNGWHAYLVKNRHQAVATMGFQWQQLYEQIVDGDGLSAQTLTLTALDYAQQPRPGRSAALDVVHEPVPARYGPLRYSALGRHGVLAKVARNMASYLQGDRPAGQAGTHRAAPRDLAPLLALLRESGATTVLGLGEGQDWLPGLVAQLPGLRVAHGEPADLLLLPTPDAADFGRLAPQAGALARQRIVTWAAHRGEPEALRQALLAWYEQGWEPQLLQTMGYRALASYSTQRQGAIVLQPVERAKLEKARVVRELLCALDTAPAPWTDPAADQLHHPLQDLRLQGSPF